MKPTDPSEPPPEAALRASDADRDRVADRLREALAEGRITPEEHAERIDVVYSAKTYAELEPVLSDLPPEPGADEPLGPPRAGQGAGPRVGLGKEARDTAALPPPEPQSTSIVAIFGGAERKGRWLVQPTTTVTCVFGGTSLDFRRAVLAQRDVTVNISCLFGGVDITVPPGVRVVSSVSAVFGGADVPEDDTFDADAPVIRLTGIALFGGVSVARKQIGETRAERRVERHARRHGAHGDHHRLREHRKELREELRAMRDERRAYFRELRDQRRDHLRQLREYRRRQC